MVVGFITTYAIPLRRGVLDTTFAPVTLVSSNNKTDRHDKTEIFLKVALNTITPKKIPTCRLFKTIKKRSLHPHIAGRPIVV
jgi:hypothetical protein